MDKNKLDGELEKLLTVAELSNINTLKVWLRVLTGVLNRELKNKEPNIGNLEKYEKIINTLLEYLIIQVEELDEETLVIYAPSIFETLIKTRDTLIAYTSYISSLKSDDTSDESLDLTDIHLELFKKLDALV